jgi:hypothetical protein
MMGVDLARVLDPCLLAVDCGISPDPWQADLLRKKPHRALLLASRQSGKTLTASFMGLHTALYEPGSLVLIVSPSQRQSAEMFRTVLGFYHQLTGVPELAAESVLRAEFKNGSRIVALPGQKGETIRGYSRASLIILDEASRIENDLISALTPMLATTNGNFIALSTPAGAIGWFYETWVGPEEWMRVQVNATECPRISAEFLAEQLRTMGPLKYSQEFGLVFVDTADAMFLNATIEQAFTDEIAPLWN